MVESVPILETIDNEFGGGTTSGYFTVPPAQHNPADALLYFNVLQYGKTIDISPIATDLLSRQSIFESLWNLARSRFTKALYRRNRSCLLYCGCYC